MLRNTLTIRLLVTSGAWVVLTLVITGLLLVWLFRDHIERRFDALLYDHLEENVAASELTERGVLKLNWVPSDPRFKRPRSGWYWQISQRGNVVAQSSSVWRGRLDIVAPTPGGGPRIQQLIGPGGEALRVMVEDVTLPEADVHFTFVVAGPVKDIHLDVREFAAKLSVTLAVLALGLLGAVFIQVRFGLAPLRVMRGALAAIRSGHASRLPETFPGEVQPVVSELNALLDHNAALLERARTQAGNLAHALKNPLTVIRNEAREIEGERGALLREEANAMTASIDRSLSQARAAGSGRALGARAPVAPVVDDLIFSMERLHADRGIAIHADGLDHLCFHGDAQDLEEMLGNLMDNACKWARRELRLSGEQIDGRLRISVEDDGPGIPDQARAKALQRGQRLDETVAGTGLGLAIVRDMVELYRGSLSLGGASLGGLRATLDLPAAE